MHVRIPKSVRDTILVIYVGVVFNAKRLTIHNTHRTNIYTRCIQYIYIYILYSINALLPHPRMVHAECTGWRLASRRRRRVFSPGHFDRSWPGFGKQLAVRRGRKNGIRAVVRVRATPAEIKFVLPREREEERWSSRRTKRRRKRRRRRRRRRMRT